MRLALVTGLCLASTTLACDPGETPDERATNVAVTGAPTEQLPPRSLPIAAAGWLDHEESPITPWCSVVLVAPDVAVSAARCIEGYDTDWFRVGFGATSARSYAIDEVVVQDDAKDPAHALVALHLDAPVIGIDPASLVDDPSERCDVLSVAYLHALRGDGGGRWIWSGCVERDEVQATDGFPNCHGDMGSGAFVKGGVLGIAVDIGDATDELGCAREHRLQSVTENAEFFDRALELSQPPA